MVGAAHYMGGESTKLGYIGGGHSPTLPHYGKPWSLPPDGCNSILVDLNFGRKKGDVFLCYPPT